MDRIYVVADDGRLVADTIRTARRISS